MNKALLIIDMQKGSFTTEAARWDAKEVCKRINTLSNKFRNAGSAIIHIQHDGSRFAVFVPSTKEWEIIDEIEVLNTDHNIQKTANNSFYHSNLSQLLNKLKIDKIYITGCATDFCVESTIQGAVTQDLKVVVVKDAHTTSDRPHMNAKKIIDHYNFIWANMIPTQGSLDVLSTAEIIQTL